MTYNRYELECHVTVEKFRIFYGLHTTSRIGNRHEVMLKALELESNLHHSVTENSLQNYTKKEKKRNYIPTV